MSPHGSVIAYTCGPSDASLDEVKRQEATDISSSKCLIKSKVTAVASVVSTVLLPTQILLSIITATLDLN